MIELHYEQANNYKYDVLKVILCSKKNFFIQVDEWKC